MAFNLLKKFTLIVTIKIMKHVVFPFFFERKGPCERGREDEDDGEQIINAVFLFFYF